MHIILLSGGSGKRLWPLSNDVRSKQFLKLLKDDLGKPESMLQRIYRQIKSIGGWDSITIAASASQKDLIYLQLGYEVNIVIEPERRDTFPAIALACAYLHSECNVGCEELVVVLPVDPFVDINYFHKVKEIDEAFSFKDDLSPDLVLIGAKPIFPTEKYGYIVPKHDQIKDSEDDFSQVLNVSSFKEKPTPDVAARLIEDGALWNCGVVGLKLGYVLDILSNKYLIQNMDYHSIVKAYNKLNKTSFDYEVVEKAKNIKVIPYHGKWIDLGTWQTITLEMQNQAEGNVFMEDTCINTHIINELDMPVVAMGINDSVIVVSYDGILVSNKKETHKLKNMLENVNNRPMYERKRWGKYKVMDVSDTSLTKKLIIESGKSISYQYHEHRKEVWTIISGEGILYLEGEKRKILPGEVLLINEKIKHGIKAITDLHIIEVQLGTNLIEEDITRLEMDW